MDVNVNLTIRVTTIALHVLGTGELIKIKYFRL